MNFARPLTWFVAAAVLQIVGLVALIPGVPKVLVPALFLALFAQLAGLVIASRDGS